METLVLDLPSMYADHHVVEVRRLLLETPGVDRVTASSAFRFAEISFDAAATSEAALTGKLEEAGYLAELATPEESGQPAIGGDDDLPTYFRHTAANVSVGSIAFGQEITLKGRPLWPCPGMSRPLPTSDE